MKKIFLLLTLSMVGCAPLPDVQTDMDKPIKIKQFDTDFKQKNPWWHHFQHAGLNHMAQDLEAQNLDIRMAKLRLQQLKQIKKQTKSIFYPSVNADISLSRGNSTMPFVASVGRAALATNWEMDLWGKNKATYKAAKANKKSQKQQVRAIYLVSLAELAKNVILYEQATQTIAVTQNLLRDQQQQIDLFAARTDAGLIDESFLQRAKAQKSQIEIHIPMAKRLQNMALQSLTVLLDKDSDTIKALLEASSKKNMVIPHFDKVQKIALKDLKKRPDVGAAYYHFIAQRQQMHAIEASLWPNMTLGGLLGGQEASPDRFIGGNPLWNMASNLTMPIFNFNRIKHQIKQQDYATQEAFVGYQKTIRTALSEVETSLSDYIYGLEQIKQIEKTLYHRTRTVSLAESKFEQGLTDMTDLTTAQAELNQVTLEYVTEQANTALAYIRLQQVLGQGI